MFLSPDNLPAHLSSALQKCGVLPSDILCATPFDRTEDLKSCHGFVLATKKSYLVIILSDNEAEKPCAFREHSLEVYKAFLVEELLSTSRLLAKKENGDTVHIATTTKAFHRDMGLFSSAVCNILNNEEVVFPEEDNAKFCPKCGKPFPENNPDVCMYCMDKKHLFLRMFGFFSPYKKELFAILLTMVVASCFAILAPYLSAGFFYDQVLEESGAFFGQILLVLGLLIGVKLCSRFADMFNQTVTAIVTGKMEKSLKNTVFSSIERLSMGFFTARQTGGLMTQVNTDASTVFEFFAFVLPRLLYSVISIVLLVIVLFILDPLLALFSLLPIPIFYLCIHLIYKKNAKLNAKSFSAKQKMNSHISDALGGVRVVKSFGNEETESRRFNGKSETSATADFKVSTYNNRSYPTAFIFLHLGNIAALCLGGYFVIMGRMTFGELLTFTALLGYVYGPLYFFSRIATLTANCANAMHRLFTIMDAKPEVFEAENPVFCDTVHGDIAFSHVSFSYEKGKKTIDDISFEIKAGQALGIVGHTGAGKSTLANLLIRLYDPEAGEITIDGISLKNFAFASLRKHIAIVSQETYLFSGTVLDNIRYAKEEASFEEVISAAKQAGAHDFILQMQDGYLTRIGAGFSTLSGGEKQRLSIARAILHQPKILILDEATAAMDTETEQNIQHAITHLSKGKTTITIAHRLSTLKHADFLVVVENGRVVERGTHAELLAQNDGVYHRLYTLQQEALKDAGVA